MARNRVVQNRVGLAVLRGGASAIAYYDEHVPGLIDALGVDRVKYGRTVAERMHGVRAATPEPPDPSIAIWAEALADIAPGRGAYSKCKSRGLDYNEYKRRVAAQETA